MSLLGDAIVYVLILIAVLAVVAGIMYGVARLWGPKPEESQTRASSAYEDSLGGPRSSRRPAPAGPVRPGPQAASVICVAAGPA